MPAVRAAKPRAKPYKVRHGGLHLLVQPNGSRPWRLAYRFAGKQKTIALGSYPTVSLAKAREGRERAKRLIAGGLDPSVQKRREKLASKGSADATFKSIAVEYLGNRRHALTPLYADQLVRRLEADIFPLSRHKADSRYRRARTVERVAQDRKAWRSGTGPSSASDRGPGVSLCDDHRRRRPSDPSTALKGALKAKGRQRHHTAMPREQLPAFLRALAVYDGDPRTALALRLILLTMVRTTELRAARWAEFEGHRWGRTAVAHSGRTHENALRAFSAPFNAKPLATLQELRSLPGGGSQWPFYFPRRRAKGCMSNNTVSVCALPSGMARPRDGSWLSRRRVNDPQRDGISPGLG